MIFSSFLSSRITVFITATLMFSTFGTDQLLARTKEESGAITMPAAAAGCVACHGQDGNSINPLWPGIAGQKETYLANQLRQFRDGTRTNVVMEPLVTNLSDQDIESLASWYANQTARLNPSGSAEQIKRGQQLAAYCIGCHGLGGVTVNPGWPNLAGQHAAYLAQQLMAFKSGARYNASMAPIIGKMTDEDFRALAAYYSQQSP